MRTGGLEAGTVATKPSNLLPRFFPLKKFRLTVFTSKKQFTNNVPLSFEVCKFVTFLTFRLFTAVKYCQASEGKGKFNFLNISAARAEFCTGKTGTDQKGGQLRPTAC